MDKRSRTARGTQLSALLRGIDKRFKGMRSLVLMGRNLTIDEIAQAFQEELDTMKAIGEAKAKHATAVLAHRNVTKRNRPLHRALEGYIRAAYGETLATLTDFGYGLLKVGRKSPGTKVEAAAKAKATREARHTMGKSQKKKVRGKA
jgi:hypothetical protein